jgi:hypothetical protein
MEDDIQKPTGLDKNPTNDVPTTSPLDQPVEPVEPVESTEPTSDVEPVKPAEEPVSSTEEIPEAPVE